MRKKIYQKLIINIVTECFQIPSRCKTNKTTNHFIDVSISYANQFS